MTTCLACDFGGSSVKYALIDDDATASDSGKVPAPLDSVEQFLETIGGLYERFRDRVDGISISIPGYVHPETGVLSGSGVYTALYGLSIADLVSERFGVEAFVENDGKCSALAEAWRGSLAGEEDGAVIVLGTGVAGGVIKNRRVHHGRDFAAGEFSFLLSDTADYSLMGTAFMNCGMLGVTYKMCKAKGLSFAAQDSGAVLEWLDSQFGARYPQPDAQLRDLKADGRQLFAWLDEGDADAQRIYGEFISALVVIVHNVQVTYAPQKIVVGGGLSMQQRVFDDLAIELDRLYSGTGLAPELRADVVRSTYLDEGNVMGAAFNFLTRRTQGATV